MDKTSWLLGLLVGRQIAGQRAKKIDTTIIPDGGTYYIGVTATDIGDYAGTTTILSAGEKFPETVSDGDIFVLGDYEYRYNRRSISGTWVSKDGLVGWGVTVRDKTKETYKLFLSSVNGSPVVSACEVFADCENLTTLDLRKLVTKNLTDMAGMFEGCTALTGLDLSNFDTSNAMVMSKMFYGCSGLTKLDLSSFDTSKVTHMAGMFRGCAALTELDLSSFDTSSVTNMVSMFVDCESMKAIYVGDGWDTSNANVSYMFDNCGVSAVTVKEE